MINFLKKLKRFFERHWWPVLVLAALTISLIYGSIHFFRAAILISEGKTYDPLSLLAYFDETNVTGPRAREVLDGNRYVSDVDSYEHISAPAWLPVLPPLLFAPLVLISRSVPHAFIAAEFIFPFLYFFLWYGIAGLIFKGRRWPSLFSALWLCLFPYIGLFFPATSFSQLKTLIGNFLPFQHGLSRDRLSLVLMESFIPDFLIFGAALYFLFKSFLTAKAKYYAALGVSIGLMFYTYFYHWTFTFCAALLLFLYAILQKDRQRIRGFLICFGAAAAIAFGYVLQYLAANQLPQYQQIIARLWIEHGRTFRISEWPYYAAVLFFLFVFWRIWKRIETDDADKRVMLVIGSMLATGVFALNAQIVTGFNIQPSHWMPRTNVIALDFAMAFSGYWLFLRLRSIRWKRVCIAAFILLTAFQIIGGFHSQYVYAKAFAERMTIEPWRKKSLGWLNAHIQKNDVVLSTSLVTNYFLPLYTSARIYLPRANDTTASDEEMLDRLIIAYKLFNIPEEKLWQLFDTEANQGTMYKPEETFDDFEQRGLLYFFSAAALDQSVDGYKRTTKFQMPKSAREYLQSAYVMMGSFDQDWQSKYRIDYVYFGPKEREMSSVDPDSLSFLEHVYSEGGVDIYKIAPRFTNN